MKPSRISYYGKCRKNKNGVMRGYSTVGPMVFIVSLLILFLIVMAVFGVDSLNKGMGRIAVILAFCVSVILAIFCRIAVSSAVKMDDKAIYFSKIPFMWRKYEIDDIVENERVCRAVLSREQRIHICDLKGNGGYTDGIICRWPGVLYGIYLKDRPEHAGCETGPCVVQEIRSGKG